MRNPNKNKYQGGRLVKQVRPQHTKTEFEKAIQPTIQNGKPAYLRYVGTNEKRTYKEYFVILMRVVRESPDDLVALPLKKELLDVLDRMQSRYVRDQLRVNRCLPRQKQEDLRSAVLDTVNNQWQCVKEIREQVLEIVEDIVPFEYITTGRVSQILLHLTAEDLLEMQKFDNEDGHAVNYYRLKQEEDEEE